jgi:hypothetical protein
MEGGDRGFTVSRVPAANTYFRMSMGIADVSLGNLGVVVRDTSAGDSADGCSAGILLREVRMGKRVAWDDENDIRRRDFARRHRLYVEEGPGE